MSDLSFSGKKWTSAPFIENISHLKKRLLGQRNLFDESEIKRFIHPQVGDLHDPYLMADMQRVVDRIVQAIDHKERIMIYGDFDTDGITSTVILTQGLRDIGGMVSYRIPDRNADSHGLKDYLLDEIFSKHVSLVITCDCGINDVRELQYAQDHGVDVIVTDHHHPAPNIERPAYGILNPLLDTAYPDKNLSGAGVAFKLIQALYQKLNKESDLPQFLEVTAVGLVADCVPLRGESRIMAKLGLQNMKQTSWTGLKRLFEYSEIDTRTIDEQTVGFHIAPRLNAASRVGDVMMAVQLFLGDSERHTYRIQQLEVFNEYRKELTHFAFSQSLVQIRSGAPFQMLHHTEWEPGILGLVASRHSEQLSVPVVASTIRDDGRLGASCRAPQGFSMIDALQECAHLLDHFGGHEGAAGFITDPTHFDTILSTLDQCFLGQSAANSQMPCDGFLDESLVHLDTVDFLRDLGPFGIGNLEPFFAFSDVEVVNFDVVGKTKNHVKITFRTPHNLLTGIAFFAENIISKLRIHQRLDILYALSDSYWNGQRRIEIRIKDVRFHIDT